MKVALSRFFRPRRRDSIDAPAPVAYDQHSLLINGQRIVIRSGAFHYFRLPSPDLWKDRLLKIKRAGYNTVDLYFYWGYHSPARGVYDFTGLRDVDRLLSLCKEVGLYVIARPGPFINAEVDGGGHPAWLLAETDVPLRCLREGRHVDSPQYLAYAREWYEQIIPRLLPHDNIILFQIENEYFNDDLDPTYMRFLHHLARELGVKCPIIHNDLWKQGCWSDLVDIYGVDDYAVTSLASDWRGNANVMAGLDRLDEVRERYCTKSPLSIFELQGGWFDPWTGIGYEAIRRNLGRENMELVTWTALAQGTTIYSHYMFAGGTNWDHIGAPPVHTSYDYGAPVYEWGGVSDRYQAAKAIAMLVGSFEEVFALSEPCDDVRSDDAGLLYKARRQGDTYLAFLRNLTGQLRSTTLKANGVETGPVVVAPWSMRVVMLNLPCADAHVTAACQVLTAMHLENQHLMVFYGPGRVRWDVPASCRLLRDDVGCSIEGTRLVADYDGKGWKDVVFSAGGHRYRSLFLPNADEAWCVGDYLVVGASYVGESRLKGGITDLPRYEMRVQTAGAKAKTLRVYALGGLNRAEINDEMVHASEDSIAGYLRFEMSAAPEIRLPTLGPWRVQPAGETREGDESAGWRLLPAGESLEMDRLGISRGVAWYRARYSGKMPHIRLAIRHNAALYVNGRFVARLDNYQSEATDGEPESADVPPVQIDLPVDGQTDGTNTLTILVESLGHNKGFLGNERLPRGVLAVEADRPLAWSVRAGIVGEDVVTQPSFDDKTWPSVADLSMGPTDDVVWARTRFVLDLPENAFAPLGLWFEGVADKAHIYLNGMLIARDWSVSPQRCFYLPEGVLNGRGENVLALLLWRRGDAPAAGRIELQAYTIEASHRVSVL